MTTTTVRNTSLSNNQESRTLYTPYRNVGIEFGFIMILTAILGIFFPNFLGLNLSFMHSLVLGVSGALSVYSGVDKKPKEAYRINLGLGIFFLLNAVVGVLVGDHGVARFGFYTPIQLERMAPGFLELAGTDHLVHALLALVFFAEAFSWKFQLHPSHESSFLHSRTFKVGMRVLAITIVLTIILSVVYEIRG